MSRAGIVRGLIYMATIWAVLVFLHPDAPLWAVGGFAMLAFFIGTTDR